MTPSPVTRLASAADPTTYGEYRIRRDPGDPRPLIRFTGRITEDGPFTAQPLRYHVYGGWFCPWSHRVAITRALAGLTGIVTMSYVDGVRDGRGWAFRERYGPDPVNGFALLREAYEATEPGFDGHVSVPALWDRVTATVASNEYKGIGIDLATRFRHLAEPVIDTYPVEHRDEIEELDAWIGPQVNRGGAVQEAFARLDERLAHTRYLIGDRVTEADVRLWVSLVRHDGDLGVFPHLWAYARDLYRLPAFRDTTDFSAYGASAARRTDWDPGTDRDPV